MVFITKSEALAVQELVVLILRQSVLLLLEWVGNTSLLI